ncbi:MAG: Heme/hemopexin transporter protein HuxB [Pseudomonas fluorescens]|nr:MAG: Heme/hemopexin transporter protein HuxB [Pseudomonas fluorescens]
MSPSFPITRVRRAAGPGRLSLLAAALIALHAQADTLPSSGTLFDSSRSILRPADTPQAPRGGSVRIESQHDEALEPRETGTSTVKLTVKQFVLQGNRHLDDALVQAPLRPYTGRTLDLAGLREAAAQVTALYRARGYLVARAYLPAQDIEAGRVTLGISEGVIGHVIALPDADVRLRPGVQQQFVEALPAGSVIREQDLERVLLRLSDITGVAVRAILRPSQQPGAADIVLKLSEMTAITARASIDNYGNYYTGSNRLTSSVSLNDAFGLGESFTVNSQNSFEGLEIKGVGFAQPLGASGISVGANYAELEYAIGKNLKGARAGGTAEVSSVFINSSLLRSRDNNISLTLAEDHRRFEDSAGGFTVDKKAVFRSATLYGNWRDNWQGSNTWSLAYGVGDLDKNTPIDAALDALTAKAAGRYQKANLNVSRLQSLGNGYSLFGSLSGQWADRNLDASEKLSLGGPNGVRAYPVGEVAGDEGVLGRLELRKYLGRFSGGIAEGTLFADAGRVRVNKQPWDRSENYLSRYGYGLGVNFYHRDLVMNTSLAFSPGNDPTSDDRAARRLWFSISGSPQAFAGLASDIGSKGEDFEVAETDTVIYGSLGIVPEYVNRYGASRAAPADQSRLATANGRNMSGFWRARDNVSALGVHGGYALDDAWKLLWQLEYGISLNYTDGSDPSVPKIVSPRTKLRNSGAAFNNGDYGTLLYGVWDMPMKESTTSLDPFNGKTSAAYFNIIGSPGFSAGLSTNVNGPNAYDADSSNGDAAFNRRQAGVVQYWTPEWNGLQLKLAYSNNGMSVANDVDKGYIYGSSLVWNYGGLTAVFAAERHVNYFGIINLGRNARGVGSSTHVTSGTSSDDFSLRYGLAYDFGDTKVSVIADDVSYSEDGVINNSLTTSDLSSYRRRAYLLGVSHKLGAWRLKASYGKALPGKCSMIRATDVDCDTHGMGATQYAIGANYKLTKRTDLFAQYVLLKNQSLANYNFALTGVYGASGYSPGVGTTISAIGTGINYSF